MKLHQPVPLANLAVPALCIQLNKVVVRSLVPAVATAKVEALEVIRVPCLVVALYPQQLRGGEGQFGVTSRT